MQEACVKTPSCMLTVVGLTEEALREIITSSLSHHHNNPQACIANYLFPQGYVVSGSEEQVKWIGSEAKKSGAILREVRVSGAFHSQFMASAVPKLREALEGVDIRFPIHSVYSNVTGLPYGSVAEIRAGLALQLTSPVMWEAIVTHMLEHHLRNGKERGLRFIEVGPGRQLRSMLKRISRDAYKSCENISV